MGWLVLMKIILVITLILLEKNRNSIKMSYNDRIDVSEGSDVHKRSASRECIICHYWYLCNGCQYLLMISMNRNNISI